MMPIMTVTFIIKFIGAVEYYGNSEEVRLICFANLHFYIVAFLYYEPKQNPLSQEGGFLFVLFIFHYSSFIIHFSPSDFE